MAQVLALIDGHSLVHRAYHAIPPLTTSKGELVNAVYGFANMLLKVLGEIRPNMVAVAFDKAVPTFRHKEFPAYKAQRAKTEEALSRQFGRVREVVEAFAFPIYEVEGFEADDVLGTLATQASQRGIDAVIVTGDLDPLQLVGPHIRVLATRRGITDTTVYDDRAVLERYGLRPSQLADYKGLVGDASDNIPGISGIGEKTAARLLREHESLENLYNNLDKVEPKLQQTLAEHREQAFMGKHLVTIITQVEVVLDLTASRVGKHDPERLLSLFRELEFRSLLGKLPRDGGVEERVLEMGKAQPAEGVQLPLLSPAGSVLGAAQPESQVIVGTKSRETTRAERTGWQIVDNKQDLINLASDLKARGVFSPQIFTDDQGGMRPRLVGMAVAYKSGEGFYIPIIPTAGAGSGLPLPLVRDVLGPVFLDSQVAKYTHDAKPGILALSREGIPVEGLVFDTALAAHLLDSSQRSFALKELAWAHLGLDISAISDLLGQGKRQLSAAGLPIAELARYGATAADVILQLVKPLRTALEGAGLWKLFAVLEMPLVGVLARMEEAGVALDVPLLTTISRELHQKIGHLEARIYEQAGHRFNINSPQQLASVLFEELGLPSAKKTKTGYSTDASVLEELRGAHPIVDLIFDYRQLAKLKSTYVDALPLLINPESGRLHTTFNQTGAATGRLSSSDPNLQNIPIRTEEGRRIRNAFIAGQPDEVLLSADYSQIELRLLAHYSRDPSLLAAFMADEDIHAATAAELFDVPTNAVNGDMRRLAKTVNFGVLYGISDYGLGWRVRLSRQEAAEYISKYFAKYAGVKKYVEETIKQAERQGFVTTLLGRRRYIPEINAAHKVLKAAAERAAVNSPLQGSAADIIKLAMVRVDKALRERKLRSRMILQVHDELLFEVPVEELEELKPLVKGIMESALPIAVPLRVDLKVGRNWGEMG